VIVRYIIFSSIFLFDLFDNKNLLCDLGDSSRLGDKIFIDDIIIVSCYIKLWYNSIKGEKHEMRSL